MSVQPHSHGKLQAGTDDPRLREACQALREGQA
jgi:hypothetical protein